MPTNWTESKRMALISVVMILLIAALGYAFYIGPLYLKISLIVILGFLSLTVYRHSRRTEYECPNCHTVFRATFLADLASPHYPNRKLLVCKSCRYTGFIPVKK